MKIYLAGPIFTYGDLLRNTEWAKKVPSDLPVYNIAGDQDPVGHGHEAVEGRDETLCHLDEVFGFGTGITDRFDVFEDLIRGGFGQGFGCGVRRKEGRGDHVHPFVGALGGEHHRHKALEGICEV